MFAPVAEVVDSDDALFELLVHGCSETANNDTSKVASVERLCNVGRAEINYNFLTTFRRVG
jgi:hypothetical protein